ncbi:MAG: phosphoenolpyruvate-utilizing N-terminal domain-containing protein, partial [Longimicrobiales bacterium]
MMIRDGSPASEGVAIGPVRLIEWRLPEVPHQVVGEEDAPRELERFDQALSAARSRLVTVKDGIATRLGAVEARIFDPQ